jgi:hypothetical protein
MAFLFPRACCACVILACWVKSVSPTVGAHCAWLGVLLLLASASSFGLVGIVFFVAVLGEERDDVGECLIWRAIASNSFDLAVALLRRLAVSLSCISLRATAAVAILAMNSRNLSPLLASHVWSALSYLFLPVVPPLFCS